MSETGEANSLHVLQELNDLVAISRYAGIRYDLIQAGGGNTSVKTDRGLFVKASGLALNDVSAEKGHCCVEWRSLANFLEQCDSSTDARQLEHAGATEVQKALLSTDGKPSIETLMHCLMNRLTLHTHPVSVAAVACRSDYKKVFRELFEDAICVDYKTPGAALAVAIAHELKAQNWRTGTPAIVFLQNHGLIVSAQTADEVIALTENVNAKVADYIDLDLSRYKLAPRIADFINRHARANLTAYLSEDSILSEIANQNQEILLSTPATPDQLVYCGATCFIFDQQNENANVKNLELFLAKYKQPPKVVSVEQNSRRYVVLLAPTLHKCKDAEDVLKAHCLTLAGRKEKAKLLPESEIAFLANWDAEKYRQKI